MAEQLAGASIQPDRPDRQIVAFVHIPKTAGGTTISMLNNAFGARAVRDVGNYYTGRERTIAKVERAWSRREGARVLVGHVPLGVFRQFLPQDVPYVTILRDPVERVLSHYYRHIGAPRRPGSNKPPKQSLEEVLATGLVEVSNLQTRMLCNDPDLPLEIPSDALDQAKANLDGMSFVGVQERFNESLVLMQRALGLDRIVPYARNRHVGGGRPSARDLDPAHRRLIEDANAFDIEVYEHGRALFEKSLASVGDGFREDVENLRAASAELSSETDAEMEATTRWLLQQLPPGTTRPIAEIFAAADAEGVPHEALLRARQQLRVRRKGVDAEGRELWKLRAPGAKEAKRDAKAARRRSDVANA